MYAFTYSPFITMTDIDTTLKIIGAVLGIMAILFPVVAAAVMWKASQHFATKRSLRGAVKRVERDLDARVEQIKKQIDRDHTLVMAAILESREGLTKEINGVGERITGIQRLTELAMSRADAAQHEGDLLRARVEAIDTHGTKKTGKLEEQLNSLSSNLSLFNKLIEQGYLAPTRHTTKGEGR
jgi:hypothetical protein